MATPHENTPLVQLDNSRPIDSQELDYKLFEGLLLDNFAAQEGVQPEYINFGKGGAPREQRQATATMEAQTKA